jgi:hypothetical protein
MNVVFRSRSEPDVAFCSGEAGHSATENEWSTTEGHGEKWRAGGSFRKSSRRVRTKCALRQKAHMGLRGCSIASPMGAPREALLNPSPWSSVALNPSSVVNNPFLLSRNDQKPPPSRTPFGESRVNDRKAA